MNYLLKTFLLFILISPIYSVAQQNGYSYLTKQQIIDSIKVHPNLKYDLKFKCFKKLNLNDINNIYGENDSLKMMIGNYKSKHKLTTAGLVMMSLALIDIIALPIIFKHAESPISETAYLIAGVTFYPLCISGTIAYSVGPKKKNIYLSLRKYHREHTVE